MGGRAVFGRLRKPGHLAVQGALVLSLLVAAASPAFAAKPSGPGHGGGGGGTSATTGNDISWPQCGGSYPSGQAFGIVGVNGGLADNSNPCLDSELSWALASPGVTTRTGGTQPPASLYVNTGDPGPSDWTALEGEEGDYGTCSGSNPNACAWQYGYNMATADVANAITSLGSSVPRSFSSPADYPWWLDVETGNTWQTGTSGQAMNVADLAGMVYELEKVADIPATNIGVYSTSYQWTTITGGSNTYTSTLYPYHSEASELAGLNDWIPGARSASGAQTNCTAQTAFTGGKVTLTQWFGHTFDGDVAC